MNTNRRNFIKKSLYTTAGIGLVSAVPFGFINANQDNGLKISLAEWSFHKALFDGSMTNLDFPVRSAKEFEIFGVEYVSTFFMGTGKNYLNELLQRSKDNNVENVLIMIDGEGDLGDSYAPRRIQAVERHYRWVDAAKFLGCKSIRVNARGDGSAKELADAVVDSLRKLAEYGGAENINIIVENHGGYSSDGKWITGVIKRVGMDNCGLLPDFGNFKISEDKQYDRYLGVKEMMPFAKGVSGKSYDFDDNGNETTIDFYKMLKIIADSGYKGWIDVEYEGQKLSEEDGIRATKKLLEKAIAKV